MESIFAYKRTALFFVVTIAVWMVSFRKPFVGIVYFQLFSMLFLQHVFPMLQPFRVPYFTALISMVAWIIIERKKGKILARESILMIAFFGVMYLSTLLAGKSPLQVESVEFFLKLTMAHILIINLIDSKEKLWLFAIILPIATADLATITGLDDSVAPYDWFNKNLYGDYLVGTVAFAAFFAMRNKSINERLFWSFIFLVLVMGVVRSYSRGAFVGFATAIFLTLLLNLRVRNLIILALAGILILPRINEKYIQRITSILDYEEQITALQRFGTIGAGLRMVESRPIFGIGVDQFADNFSKYATWEQMEMVGGDIGRERIKPHNLYIQIVSETGIVGFTIFGVLILTVLANVVRIRRYTDRLDNTRIIAEAGAISIIGMCASGVAINNGYSLMLYTLVSLVTAARRVAEKDASKSMYEWRVAQADVPLSTPTTEKIMIPDQYKVVFLVGLYALITYLSYW